MIEIIVRDHLSKNFIIPVHTERPVSPPKTYILIQRVGGKCRCGISKAMIAVHSIAPSMQKAAELNAKIQAAMKELGGNVGAVDINATSNYTNTQTKEYRYQTLFQITYMED